MLGDMELIALARAVATRRSTLGAVIRTRFAIGQDVILITRTETVAACFRADVAVVVRARSAGGFRNVRLVAVALAITAGTAAFGAIVVTRLAVRQHMLLIASTGAVAARLGTDVAISIVAGLAIGRYVSLIAGA